MRIFTIGYEGTSPEEFLARLTSAGVVCLVDVREAPISRKKGFSKSALATAMAASGIGYQHMRALGCPKPVRDRYRDDGDWMSYTQAFMAHLQEQDVALNDLATQVRKEPTALLCYEADFNRCHRTYVALAVARDVGGQVIHLTCDGETRAEG